MRLKKELFFAVGICAVMICAVLSLREKNDSAVVPAGATFAEKNKINVLDEVASSALNTPAITSEKSPAGQAGSLDQALQHSRNWRQLYLAFLQRMDEGGGFYAANLLVRCEAIRYHKAPQSWMASSAAQARAKTLREERCASFIDQEVSAEAIAALQMDPRIKSDPLMAKSSTLRSEAADPAQRRQAIVSILETKDPLFLEKFSSVLFSENAGGIQFDGVRYSQDFAPRVFGAAWMAAACEAASGSCGQQDDFYVVDACTLRNQCFSSREQLFREDVKSNFGAEALSLYMLAYPKLVQAIKQNDPTIFNRRI